MEKTPVDNDNLYFSTMERTPVDSDDNPDVDSG